MADFRVIPSIEQLRQRAGVQTLSARYGDERTLAALREVATQLRDQMATPAGSTPATSSEAAAYLERRAAETLAQTFRPSLRRVINATGVIVHTNLGRAPLARAAVDRLEELGGGYSNLEYDIAAGTRGTRRGHAEALLRTLTGAEAAVVVNNCAAAMLLVLSALARGREVIISRAELVEIGGGFRVPDVLAQSGARLREVGTTNRTRLGDYALAIGERTGALVRVHPSNFRIEGFTERASLVDLAALAQRFSIPLIEDLGSGWLRDRPAPSPLADEPSVEASIAAGVDIACFSGDKLLGGPQAGVIVGRAALVDRVAGHPLMRALRVDKLTYAALEATLMEHLGGRADESVPVMRMIAMPLDAIVARAEALAARIAAPLSATLVDAFSTIGGGSAPGRVLPTRAVAFVHAEISSAALEARLREARPAIVARIENDRVLIDLRTVLPEEDPLLIEGLLAAANGTRM